MTNVESFEVTRGGRSGDLLTERKPAGRLKVGLLATAYFEYFRMYENIEADSRADMQVIADRLAAKHDLVYPGMVSTVDEADAAGRAFRAQGIDLLVITESTYTTDYMLHQALNHLPSDIPILVFASQAHGKLDFKCNYDVSLRNSGPMGLIQLTGGFRKMGKYPKYEVVVGSIYDDEAYAEIDRFIRVQTTIAELRNWTIGVIGHVFRGMYDFQYDKTDVQGTLGPHVMEIHSGHLLDIWKELSHDDPEVVDLKNMIYASYEVQGLTEIEILRASRLSVALQKLVDRYKLNGLALLGQHYIEKLCNSTCHLGCAELLRKDLAIAVTEGDVLGLIMSKVLKDFTGVTPFFGEWEEADLSRNAVMLLGHGFIDTRTERRDRPVVVPTSEEWGFEGNGFGFQGSFKPGPVTMTHIIRDVKGWRLLISGGEVMDVPPFENLGESAMVVKVDLPVKEYFKRLMKHGFSHHSIAVYGEVQDHLEIFAEQLGLEVCRL